MMFEIINDKSVAVMGTDYVSCIPDDEQLNSVSKAGYKFKLNGKAASLKKVKEFKSDTSNL